MSFKIPPAVSNREAFESLEAYCNTLGEALTQALALADTLQVKVLNLEAKHEALVSRVRKMDAATYPWPCGDGDDGK